MKKNVILSIKPKYVEQIINRSKKYEYRKRIFKQSVNKVYIYESSPTKRIRGYFYYTGTLEGTPEEIWNRTKLYSGINKKAYDKYFSNKLFAYAIKIEEIYIFDEAINPKNILKNFIAPQSYMYLERDID